MQFRIAGTACVVAAGTRDESLADFRQQIWSKLSDATRVQYSWPQAGEDLDQHRVEIASPVPREDSAPDTFAILLLIPEHVDVLVLGDPPKRTIHTYSDQHGWTSKEINP